MFRLVVVDREVDDQGGAGLRHVSWSARPVSTGDTIMVFASVMFGGLAYAVADRFLFYPVPTLCWVLTSVLTWLALTGRITVRGAPQ